MTTTAALTLTDVGCVAGTRPLFDQLSLSVAAGSWTMLTGPNGSGKTTLLRAVAGLIRPVSGQVQWQGRSLQPTDRPWQRQFFYQGHSSALKAEFSATENLALQATLDLGQRVPPRLIDDALARVGLTRARHVLAARLSAGQARRLNLARLLCGTRPLWLLDEPTNALDQDGLKLLAELLDDHLDGAGCALVASHQPLSTRHPPTRFDIGVRSPRDRVPPAVTPIAVP